ncbi:MAG: hypothetical protein JSY10_05725 [Paenibacillus sp.]|nr:hypothetical protein [Paenibacillus sp.]
MKRTSEKESSPSLKKTKTEHGESSQSKLIIPAKSNYEKRESKNNLIASMIQPKPVPEPIVLSSDDEDDIIMQKNVLAESLNDSETNTISTGQKKDIIVPKVGETILNKLNTATERASITPIPETVASAMDISNLDDDEDDNDAFVDANANSPFATASSFADDMSEVDELRSDSEIDEADEKEKHEKVDETEEEEKVNEVAQATSAINNDEKENKDAMEVCDDTIQISSDITENTNKNEESEATEATTKSMESSDDVTEVNAVKTALVQDENEIVDIESMDISEGNIEPSNKVEHVNNTSANIISTSSNRPVREHASKVKTYNDIANSIDPTKLTYVSSDDDDDSKPPTIILARKPTKPRASPTKTMRPSVILSKFTKELTSRRQLKTGFVYDTAMSYHATPNPMEIHPEDPRRIFKIFNILEQHGILRECRRIVSRRATKQEILLVHNIIHYRKLRDTEGWFLLSLFFNAKKKVYQVQIFILFTRFKMSFGLHGYGK